MIKLNILKYKNKAVNNHSLYDNSPFFHHNNTLYIKKDFYINEFWFIEKINKIQNIDKICITNILPLYSVEKRNDIWWKIYELYVSSFFADNYKEICGGVIIDIYDYERNIIKNNKLTDINLYNLNERIKNSMEINKKYFVKTTGFTPKKIKDIKALTKDDNILEYLFDSDNMSSHDRCIKFLDYSNILIKEWKEDIKLDKELRIFIENKKIKYISQQDPLQEHYYLSYVLRNNYEEIYENCVKLWNFIKDKVIYTYCILDVYIDENLDVHLIEINPTHSWSGAGSALFTWEEIECKKSDIEIRVY